MRAWNRDGSRGQWPRRSSFHVPLFQPESVSWSDSFVLEPHCVELLDDPLDAVVAPERFAVDDKSWHAEDVVASAGGECFLEFARAVVKRIAFEAVRVEADF